MEKADAATNLAKAPPHSVAGFALLTFAWMAVLITGWTYVNQWTSYPVGVIANTALEVASPSWVRQARTVGPKEADALVEPGLLEIDTHIAVLVPDSGGRRAEMVIEGDAARYAYGLPIFLALLFAARQKSMVKKALIGYVVLLPFQAFTVFFNILRDILVGANFDRQLLRISGWQVEGIVYGFQLGTLLMPTLIPILIWLWLDRDFVGVLAKQMGVTGKQRRRGSQITL